MIVNPAKNNNNKGASLLEYSVAMAVFTLLVVGVSTVMTKPLSEINGCVTENIKSFMSGHSRVECEVAEVPPIDPPPIDPPPIDPPPPSPICKALNDALKGALASKYAYQKGEGDKDALDEAGYTKVDPTKLGLPNDLFHDGSFDVELLRDADGNYTVAFRGSDDLGDFLNDNIPQALGKATEQYRKAIQLADALANILGSDNLTFTGHSLGGGLATAAALYLGRPATVYNPAGIHPSVANELGPGP